MRKFEAAERDGADDTRRALTIGRAVNWCRELVDTPSSDLTPAGLASAAAEMADSLGLWHRTWSAADLQEQRIAGICAVGRGASNPPCMAEIRLERGSGPTTVLIGKGVTCDTGGLQIKTADHEWLKADMAGAATVLAATRAAAELGLRADLRVFVPCVENMPGPNAYRTGDLITHRDGTTTEVADTDAEGRLVLADVISLAREDDPAAIIDVATLTDGTALGPDLWPFVTNSELLASAITDAAERSGEPAWRLPLWSSYASALASPHAERANAGVLPGDINAAGTILGAVFLSAFAGDTPWVHIDIAGTAVRTRGEAPLPQGATGSATAALIDFLESQERGGPS